MMTLKELKNVGAMVTSFLSMFNMCFESLSGRQLLRLYVQGQLSDLQRKNCEAIALTFGCCVRTLQRFLESIKWDEERLRDRCQEIIARDHAHPEAGVLKTLYCRGFSFTPVLLRICLWFSDRPFGVWIGVFDQGSFQSSDRHFSTERRPARRRWCSD